MAENENKQENVVVEDFKRTNAKKSKKKFRHRQQNPVLAFRARRTLRMRYLSVSETGWRAVGLAGIGR